MLELWTYRIYLSELTPFVANIKTLVQYTLLQCWAQNKNFLITLYLLSRRNNGKLMQYWNESVVLAMFLCFVLWNAPIHTFAILFGISSRFYNNFRMGKLLIIRKRIRLWPGLSGYSMIKLNENTRRTRIFLEKLRQRTLFCHCSTRKCFILIKIKAQFFSSHFVNICTMHTDSIL